MKTYKFAIVFVLAAALLGCGKHEHRHIVILPDVSGSIDRESLEQTFKAIDELAGHLQRGDRLTIIPILGDAEAEASGKILRFEVPANRQAYDADIRGFRIKMNSALTEMLTSAISHPGTQTDILGSILLGQQEFQMEAAKSKRTLIILSDLIQEDHQLNFRRDKRFDSESSTREFARQTARGNGEGLRGTRIYLGMLRSREYGDLSRAHRLRIQEYWIQYFDFMNGEPMLTVDGAGLLKQFN
jgi:hypothetical protein